MNDVSGIPRGSWYFDPFELKLHSIPDSRDMTAHYNSLTRTVLRLKHGSPPAVLVFAAVLERTLARYENGMSLVWRDAGSLAATICLTAESLGLAACPLGFSSPLIAPKKLGLKGGAAWIMGGVALGERAE